MNRQQRPITDRELGACLAAGAVDRGVGEGLTFVASLAAANAGKASWILRYRFNGRAISLIDLPSRRRIARILPINAMVITLSLLPQKRAG